jgi:hypothetical protein
LFRGELGGTGRAAKLAQGDGGGIFSHVLSASERSLLHFVELDLSAV